MGSISNTNKTCHQKGQICKYANVQSCRILNAILQQQICVNFICDSIIYSPNSFVNLASLDIRWNVTHADSR